MNPKRRPRTPVRPSVLHAGPQRFVRPDLNPANKDMHDKMRLHKQILAELRGEDLRLSLQPILLGSTKDGKYRAKFPSGDVVFLRISETATEMRSLKREYELLQKFRDAGVPAPIPIEFGQNDKAAYFMVEWVEGGDLLNAFQTISEDKAYEYGYKVGELIHQASRVNPLESPVDWSQTYRHVILKNLVRIHKSLSLDTPGFDEILSYAYNIRGVLEGRPQLLIHSDLKPANIVLNPGGSFKVVDWGTYLYGDPLFCLIHALDSHESISYAIGKYHAFFGGEPTYEDWRLISLYHLSAALYVLYSRLDMLNNTEQIHLDRYIATLLSYDYLNNPVPEWYANDPRTRTP